MVPKNEYAPYFEQYLQLVNQEKSIVENLVASQNDFEQTLSNIDASKHNFAYDKGKWTLKELIQHTIDTERVFIYRALCFARNDKTDLPGFDQDIFTQNDNANQREFDELLNEMKVVRESSIALFQSFSDEAFQRIGVASNNTMSVRALGYLFSGHQIHHLNIVKERYL
ncbi:DinB family protein [Polaribacter sp. P097]|uniref:DinB family protein n=1 Tax=Polaribacter sp. P097 TaxID=3117398 RepID=UPI002FDF986C